MTLGKLKKLLALVDAPDSTLLVLAIDPEGNGFSPLADISGLGKYVEYEGQFYSGDDVTEIKGKKAICLWP